MVTILKYFGRALSTCGFYKWAFFFFIAHNISPQRLMHKILIAYRRVLNKFYAQLTTGLGINCKKSFPGGRSIFMIFKRVSIENLSKNH